MAKRRGARRSGDPRRRALVALPEAVGESPRPEPMPSVWRVDQVDDVDERDARAVLRDLRRLPGQRRELERRQGQLVRELRDLGGTWTEVGRALGISPQAAQKRYGKR